MSDAMVDKIDAAMATLNNLSNYAKAKGDDRLMYAANRAWNELFDARHERDSQSARRV